jgi:hypothetical protein|tara:strand:- start:334 stop:456 length:123 start_codon:yes stop_codon:yes gene_type:complete
MVPGTLIRDKRYKRLNEKNKKQSNVTTKILQRDYNSNNRK